MADMHWFQRIVRLMGWTIIIVANVIAGFTEFKESLFIVGLILIAWSHESW